MSEQNKQTEQAMPNDVGEWGSRPDRGNADYTRPFMVAGEPVDLDRCPQFGDEPPAGSKRAPLRK